MRAVHALALTSIAPAAVSSIMIVPSEVKVTVVGGGNAAQVLAALLPHKGFVTSLYCPYKDEAKNIRDGISEQGHMLARFAPHNEVKGDIKGVPVKISKDPSEVIPEADVILMPLPSFAYPAVLEGMRSHLRPGQKLAVTPGQGGFDWTARDVLGEELMRQLTIYAIMPMPFNCRIKKFGKLVEVQEFKPRYRVGCVPDSELDHVMALNEAMFGSTESCGSFLACTLYPINAIIHPARLRTLLMDWSPGQTLPENPLFYEQMTVEGTSLMDKVNKELIAVGASLKEAGIPVEVPHIFDFLAKYVYADPSDTLLGFFAGNAAYKGFRCPLKQTESGGWEPDFQNRYFTEDIPLGLCIYKGVADLVGVETPAMDEIIIWAGKHMGKSYIEGGHLSGSDIKETSAPQRFGINTLADLKHRYPSNSVSS